MRDPPGDQRGPNGGTTVWLDTGQLGIVALITRMGELAGEHNQLRMRIVPQPPG